MTIKSFNIISISVYPDEDWPGSGTTKLDSVARKRLIRSRIAGYGPRPQACARLARAAVVPPASAQASWRTRRPLGRPALVARADFLKMGNFAPFSQFLHIKGWNFPDVFIRSRLPLTPINHKKFHGNRSARFWEIRKTDRQTWQLYIIIDSEQLCLERPNHRSWFASLLNTTICKQKYFAM